MRLSKIEKRREEIEKVALEVLIENGYYSASMLRVARQACCSNETLYRWYGSKTSLLAALVKKNCAALAAEIRQFQGSDGLSALEAMGEAILQRMLSPQTVALIRAVMADQDANPAAEPVLDYMDVLFSEETINCLEEHARIALFGGDSLPGKEGTEVIDTFLSLLLGDLLVRNTLGRKIKLTKKQRVARSRDAVDKTYRIYSDTGRC